LPEKSTAKEGEPLQAYMKLYNEFIPDFADLAARISRKNFNPHGWFVLAKP